MVVNQWIGTFLLLLISILGYGQTYDPGVVYDGTDGYVTYHAGNLPLIISASHGGALVPTTIPNRSCNGCVTVTDAFTQELAELLLDKIKDYTGCDAHVVINQLKRTKLDANRAIEEAALGNAEAELAWNEYHGFMDSAKVDVSRNWGRGLVIDLHGHGHDIQRLELGYRVSGSELRMSDYELDVIDISDSPIRSFIHSAGITLSEALRGPESLGALFMDSGYDAVPSDEIAAPESGEAYFSGGYITDRYGSGDGGQIDAIQIECNQDVRFTNSARERFADSLAVVLLDFLDTHYHMNLRSGACEPTSLRESTQIKEINVYPNPACDVIHLSINRKVDDVTLFNNIGQVVHQSQGSSDLSVKNLPRGMYHLLVEAEGEVYRQRIIVQWN